MILRNGVIEAIKETEQRIADLQDERREINRILDTVHLGSFQQRLMHRKRRHSISVLLNYNTKKLRSLKTQLNENPD